MFFKPAGAIVKNWLKPKILPQVGFISFNYSNFAVNLFL